MRTLSRRSLLGWGLKLPVAGAAAAALGACSGGGGGSDPAASGAATACADASNLTASEGSLRQASAYVEKAPDPAKTCAGCTFFTADPNGGPCGTCQIFVGGPANAQGHCASWAAKTATAG
jgi:hypothetical protein